MQLLTLGLNHTIAQVGLRERMAFPAESLPGALADLRRGTSGLVAETAILSTCNRTELYCAVREPAAAHGALLEWLAANSALPAGQLRARLYALRDGLAVRHAFRVASGLDSMVLGEPQILGQMKDAARHAQQAGTLGMHLHQLFQRSFAVAKEVRSRTEIGAASVSVASAAVRAAHELLGDLRETRVLFVGAGKMTQLAAAHFAARHPRQIVVTSRTSANAEALARRFGTQTMPLADLAQRIDEFEVVVCAASSSAPIIGPAMLERARCARAGRPLFMADLAVPRNIDPAVGRLPGVSLYTIDDLGEVARSGLEARRAAVAQAESIIDERVEAFMQWLRARQSVPLLQALHERAALLRQAELDRARRMLARGEPAEAALEALAAGLMNKFLHTPRELLAAGTLSAGEAQRLVEQWLPARARDAERLRIARSSSNAVAAATPRQPQLVLDRKAA